MKERPILFSSPMVRAIIEGRKSQTRRAVKRNAAGRAQLGGRNWHLADPEAVDACPYGKPGDLLWVRETWTLGRTTERQPRGAFLQPRKGNFQPVLYRANELANDDEHKWRPSIFMPRWASRLTLRITGVRVERLQEISEADSLAEGCRAVEAEPWWQGYKECEGELMHQQARGRVPPDWMIEPKPSYNPTFDPLACTAKQAYESLWNSINGKRAPWSSNPWVWVIEFERIEQQARAA